MLRLLTVPMIPSDKPTQDVNSKWVEAGPGTSGSFSAVGYFFGRDLRKALNVAGRLDKLILWRDAGRGVD